MHGVYKRKYVHILRVSRNFKPLTITYPNSNHPIIPGPRRPRWPHMVTLCCHRCCPHCPNGHLHALRGHENSGSSPPACGDCSSSPQQNGGRNLGILDYAQARVGMGHPEHLAGNPRRGLDWCERCPEGRELPQGQKIENLG
jgi:hypothetical protein